MTDSKTPPATYSIRMPHDMRARLEYIAQQSGRSLHAEILMRLDESLNGKPKHTDATNVEEIARRAARDEFARIAENMTGNDLRPVADMIREAIGVYRKRD